MYYASEWLVYKGDNAATLGCELEKGSKMAIQVRTFKPSDGAFINSLVTRFSEFDLLAWRSAGEIDHTNRTLLQQAMEQPEPDLAIFIIHLLWQD